MQGVGLVLLQYCVRERVIFGCLPCRSSVHSGILLRPSINIRSVAMHERRFIDVEKRGGFGKPPLIDYQRAPVHKVSTTKLTQWQAIRDDLCAFVLLLVRRGAKCQRIWWS